MCLGRITTRDRQAYDARDGDCVLVTNDPDGPHANADGSVCMDRYEAADLAERLDPDLVCPIHYDTQAFLAADSRVFAADVAGRGVPVVLDEGWA